jgi:hypothetical protein
MIIVLNIDNDICHVMRTDGSNAMVFGKRPDLGMPLERRIAGALPHAIFGEYADEAIDVAGIYRVTINLY